MGVEWIIIGLIGCTAGAGVAAYQIKKHFKTPKASFANIERVYRYSGKLKKNTYAN